MSLEKNIKKSFENFEMPYENEAWEAMNKRLDQHFPLGNSKSNLFNLKSLFLAASIISIVSLTLIYTISSDGKNDKDSKDISDVNNPIIETNSLKVIEGDKMNVASKADEIKEKQATKSINQSNVSADSKLPEIKAEKILSQNNAINKNVQVNDGQKVKPILPKINFPVLNDVCVSEKIKIENTNSDNLILISPNNKQTIIEANKSNSITVLQDGEYQIGYLLNDKFIKGSTFNAKTNSEVDFIIDNENSYNESGLPTSVLRTNSNGVDYEWFVDNRKINGASKEIETHLFKKGTYIASLIVTHSNGCKSKEIKSIKVSKDYNLLAVDAFEPSSGNIKTNSFIPFALTKRNVKFTMIIFDINGNEVFKTNDANEPWNGFDPKLNDIAKSTSMYVWKVAIENPEEGEKPNYSGSIVIK